MVAVVVVIASDDVERGVSRERSHAPEITLEGIKRRSDRSVPNPVRTCPDARLVPEVVTNDLVDAIAGKSAVSARAAHAREERRGRI
jgi:hypothetical protein